MKEQFCIDSPSAIAQALQASFKRKGWNQIDISSKSSIHQSQVCRILSGKFKRCSKNVLKLCKYAEITIVQKKADPRGNEKLMEALSYAWDGTEKHAEIIAKMLMAVKELRMRG